MVAQQAGSGAGSQHDGSGAGSGSQQVGSGAGSQQTGSGAGSQQTGSGAGSQQTGSGSGSQQTGSGSQQPHFFLNNFANNPASALGAFTLMRPKTKVAATTLFTKNFIHVSHTPKFNHSSAGQ